MKQVYSRNNKCTRPYTRICITVGAQLFAMQMSGMKKPVGQIKVCNLLNRFKLLGLDRRKSPTPLFGNGRLARDKGRERICTHAHIYTHYVYTLHPISFDIKACNNFFPSFRPRVHV